MFIRYAARVLVLFLLPAVQAGVNSIYSYDPSSPVGPDDWKYVQYTDGTVNQCNGMENSPIAILDKTECDLYADYVLNDGSCKYKDMKFEVNDHGVKATFGEGCTKPTLQIPGIDGTFEALQYHIHTGSEHTRDGVTFGAEMHIVHKMKAGCPTTPLRCYAVIGTKINPANPYNDVQFGTLLEGWIKLHNAQETACNNTANVIDYEFGASENTPMVPYQFNKGSSFHHYNGSLTTPPCSEVVIWNVDTDYISVSVEQYTDLGRIILDYKEDCKLATVAFHGSTSRPVQPLNVREVMRICPKSMEGQGTGTGLVPVPTPSSASKFALAAGSAVATTIAAILHAF